MFWLPLLTLPGQDPAIPKAGLVITKSTKFAPGVYTIPHSDESGKTGAITIRGNKITLDFTGVTLRGTPETVMPNERKGTAIRIEGKDITIKGLNVHGYKIGLIADSTDGLILRDLDLSNNWKAKLGSTWEREDLGDWMSFHQNEKDEWLKFGAAIYLKNARDFTISGVKAWGGQCGLMMTRSEGGLVYNNDFSFLSAVGLGMYRSSRNRIMHNNIDWCVRGYSHRNYNRGQDSTGILIYEQSNENVFAYNSVTHGGDGFFLWAGQTTMDTGQGGCNDNILYGNDFSHAPTNGIEATFSRNVFANNLILECWHGVWGGYSYDTVIAGNVFGLNAEAIAIEHGQSNTFDGNIFRLDTVAMKLWARESQPADWGYAQKRDTASRDTKILRNVFFDIPGIALDLQRTSNTSVRDNFIKKVGSVLTDRGNLSGLAFTGNTLMTPAPFDPAKFPAIVEWEANTLSSGASEVPSLAYMRGSGLVALGDAGSREVFDRIFKQSVWNPLVKPAPLTKSLEAANPEEVQMEAARPYYVEPLDGGNIPFLGESPRRGREFIIVDEWGPYDFRRPILALRDTVVQENGTIYIFETLGPKGKFSGIGREVSFVTDPAALPIKLPTRAKLVGQSGNVGDWVAVKVNGPFSLDYEFTGADVFDVRGVKTPAGKPFKFGYSRDEVGLDWHVRFWNWDKSTQDPRTQEAEFKKIFAGAPAAEYRSRELYGAWYGAPRTGVNADQFATIAETTASLPAGEYELTVTHDDGIRLFVGTQLVFQDWTWHGPKTDVVKVRFSGTATPIRIEHFELDGFSTLRCVVKPVK